MFNFSIPNFRLDPSYKIFLVQQALQCRFTSRWVCNCVEKKLSDVVFNTSPSHRTFCVLSVADTP